MDITQSRKSLILWPYTSGLAGRKRGASFNMTPLALPSAERRCGSQLHFASRVTPNHRTDGDHWTAVPSTRSGCRGPVPRRVNKIACVFWDWMARDRVRRFKENIKRMSVLREDMPDKPLDRAVWWTEYVLRHKGAPHLRTAAVDMPWYQFLLLDVIAFLLGIAITVFLVLYLSIKKLYHSIRSFIGKKRKLE
uniref:Uncharacterized protein n=1 Tax=Timema cristinae TaxID=61476 RepID=A0A7R9CFX7_TIMCR|nr:unnamed protein product [Timema cristinae]